MAIKPHRFAQLIALPLVIGELKPSRCQYRINLKNKLVDILQRNHASSNETNCNANNQHS